MQGAVRVEKVKVPYPMPAAFSEDVREQHMAWAVKQGYPRLHGRMMTHDSMQIIAYGPSLADTWQEINPDEPLITMSGSLKFLLEKGLKPRYGKWFHTHVDPRADNLVCVARHEDVCYLIGSCTHPLYFKALDGMKVAIYHPASGAHTHQWIAENDPNQIMVAAGSTVGLTAIHLGGIMGYYHFEIFGMEGGYKGEARHAGEHTGFKHGQRESVFNPPWITSRLMDNANVETGAMLKNFPVMCVFHGEGLMQDWVAKSDLPNAACHGTEKADLVRKARISRISIKKARELHTKGVPFLRNAA